MTGTTALPGKHEVAHDWSHGPACDGAQGKRGFPMAGGTALHVIVHGAQGDRGFPMTGGKSLHAMVHRETGGSP